MKRILIIIMILTMTFSGCQNEKRTIRIGVNSWPPCEIWYVAQEQDMFDGVDVELVRFSTWSDNMNALYLGNIDITHSTYFNNILFSEKGEWGQMIAPIDTTVGGDGLVVAKEIKDISELTGKRIAVEVSTDEHYLLYKALEMHGVAIEEVEIISASSERTADLFIEGKVDAIFTYEPYMSKAADEGNGQILFTTADIEGHMVDVLVGSKQAMEESSDVFIQVLKAYYEARDYILASGDYTTMAKNETMDEAAFEAFYNSFVYYTPEEAYEIMNSEAYDDIHKMMSDFVLDNQLASRVKTKEELINFDVINGVIEHEK